MTFEELLAHGLYRYVKLMKRSQDINKQWLFIQFKENLTGFLSYGLCYENLMNHLIENEKYNSIILDNSNYTEKELCSIISQKLKELKMIKKQQRIKEDFV
jgi:hypothetical protein